MRAAVTGTFDGVHRGHAYLLSRLRTEAERRGLEPMALTFDRHPLTLIAPDSVPSALASTAERKRLIEAEGVEAVVIPFTEELRRLSACEFLELLRRNYDVSLFLLGFNNRIGSDRVGADSPALAELSRLSGVEILVAEEDPDLTVSSSAIRDAIAVGAVESAETMLGRPYAVEGPVVTGRQLGRTIGFPTANLCVDPAFALPAPGVYAGRIMGRRAVVNIGRRPTVEGRDDAPLSVEAFILDYSGNLYGRTLRLEFLRRLRGEKRFGSIEELKTAIAADVAAARKI